MEGTTSTPKTPRAKKPKTEKAKSKKQSFNDLKVQPEPPQIKTEPFIKLEPGLISQIDPYLLAISRDSSQTHPHPFSTVASVDLARAYPPTDVPLGYLRPPMGGPWPQEVKTEAYDQEVAMRDVLVKSEPEA